MQEFNYSERFIGIVADTDPYAGNDPNIVAQSVRSYGLIPEEMLPFDDFTNPVNYYTPKPPTKDLLQEGKKWLKKFTFQHEWVEAKPEKIWNALQYSPLGVSVQAWRREGDFYVKEKGARDNHWTLIVGGEYGKYWLVYDSYLDDGVPFKKLNWGYPFGHAKLYAVEKTIHKKGFFSNLWYNVYI